MHSWRQKIYRKLLSFFGRDSSQLLLNQRRQVGSNGGVSVSDVRVLSHRQANSGELEIWCVSDEDISAAILDVLTLSATLSRVSSSGEEDSKDFSADFSSKWNACDSIAIHNTRLINYFVRIQRY